MTSYSGKLIRKTPLLPTQTSASGVWTTADAAAAVKNNTWPVAGVPDPISRSVRLRSSASAYFNRTPASATNQQKFTWSGWVKRGTLGSSVALFSAPNGSSDTTWFDLLFDANNKLNVSGFSTFWRVTTQVFRDPSAWYHIVLAVDTTQATANNRILLYVNGTQITAFDTTNNMAQNANTGINAASVHYLGRSSSSYFDGYLTEVNFVDGQALTPSSFGTTNALTGAWVPMPYTGTYGTNGFYLNFKDNTSTTTLGYDYSGNANNWTTNNISLTAGATYDSMLDVPTPWVGYNTDGGVSVTRGNYCTFNPLWYASSVFTLSNANLTFAGSGTTTGSYVVTGTWGLSSGKWYWEVTPTDIGAGPNIWIGIQGVSRGTSDPTSGLMPGTGYAYSAGGSKMQDATITAYGAAYANNDVVGIALDLDGGTLTFYKNGVSQGTAFTGISAASTPTGAYTPAIMFNLGGVARTIGGSANFGQRPFSYTPPTGFKSLCTTNLPTPTITNGANYMGASLYTGTGATQSIVNSGSNAGALTFQPDFVWIKSRNNVSNNGLFDSVRGGSKLLISELTDAEYTGTYLSSFNSNGFTIGATASSTLNASTYTYVGWQWKANGSAVTNTAGSISAQVNANTTAGFSVVTYTGNGSTGTIGHGLGAAPKFIITKYRDAVNAWQCYHVSIGAGNKLFLNQTNAQTASTTVWNNTSPTSSVFSVGDANTNASGGTYVAYCWSEVAGYSKFGSYTGNGSADGPFVYCGFRPRLILVKRTDSAGNWYIYDSSRDPINAVTESIYPNLSNAESNDGATYDFLSNGFKNRRAGVDQNASGATYIFAAFAENPFNYSNAR